MAREKIISLCAFLAQACRTSTSNMKALFVPIPVYTQHQIRCLTQDSIIFLSRLPCIVHREVGEDTCRMRVN